MDYELFEDNATTASQTDAHEDHEVLELRLDELSYVAGGCTGKHIA